jgi:hypothetical protein
MAHNSGEVLRALRTALDAVTGTTRVYSQGNDDEYRLPIGPGQVEPPAVLLVRGPTTGYELMHGLGRVRYEVYCYILLAGLDDGELAKGALDLVDACVAKLATVLKLGLSRVNLLFIGDDAGLELFEEFGGFIGHRLRVQVEEDDATVPAIG